MISLTVWGNAWIKYILAPTTGSVEIAKREKEDILSGFASREPVLGVLHRLYAVYPYQERLYFRAGKKTWDITDAKVECKYWWFLYGALSGFILKLNGKIVHHAKLIHPNRALFARMDPTYDNIDAESDHFFLFLRRQLPKKDWRDFVLSGCKIIEPQQANPPDPRSAGQ